MPYQKQLSLKMYFLTKQPCFIHAFLKWRLWFYSNLDESFQFENYISYQKKPFSTTQHAEWLVPVMRWV